MVGKPVTGSDRTYRMLRMYAGTCATFLVSGVVHEVILGAAQPDGLWGWKWLLYFTVQVSGG